MKLKIIYWCIGIIILLNFSCNDIYKAGNSSQLMGIEIESNINQDIAFKYMDTSKSLIEFQLPKRYSENLEKGGDIEYFPLSNKAIYFKNYPEEAYHLNSSGIFFLEEVYNPSIGGSNWIYDTSKLSISDFNRIEKRIDTLLNKILFLERKSKIPDSVIFLRKPYDTVICKLVN